MTDNQQPALPVTPPLVTRTARHVHLTAFAVIGLASAVVYASTVAPDLTWKNNGADGGDFVTAAMVGGVAHPTGYPTYLVLAAALQHLPFGSPALRAGLLSVLGSALAAGIVAVVVARTSPGAARLPALGAALGGLAFGLSPLLWSQAVIVEVHGLQIALTAATVLLLSLVVERDELPPWAVRLGGLLFGLAVGNHITILFLLPVWLAAVGWRSRRLHVRPLVEFIIAMMAGSLVYITLPIRAAGLPPVNWGNASTLEGFWWLVSGQNYRGYVFGLPADLLTARIGAWAGLVTAQFGWPGLLVALYGLYFGQVRSGWLKPVTLWMMIVYSVFAVGYGTSDSEAYLLPAFLALGVWFGWGVVALLQLLPPAYGWARPLFVALILLAIFSHAVSVLPSVDASRDTAALDFAADVADNAPPRAIVFTASDRDTFSLWYIHYALGRREDLAIVVEPLLPLGWYVDTLRATYPDLRLPESGVPTAIEIVRLNGRPWCNVFPDTQPHLQCAMP